MSTQVSASNISTKTVVFEKFSNVEKFLEDRYTTKYKIRGINKIEIDKGRLFVDFRLENGSNFSKYTFVPKYVYGHLAHFLNIPQSSLDYITELSKLGGNDGEIALANESDHLYGLFQRRLNNSSNRDIFLHITEDGFGKFARCITSDQYIHYPDLNAFRDFRNLIEKQNAEANANYQFSMARLTPYESLLGYVNDTETIMEDEVAKGIAQYNSEAKKRSVHFMNMLLRLVCSNGLYSKNGGGKDIRIPHTGENFDQNREAAFKIVVNAQQEFFEKFKGLEDFNRILSDDWDDFEDFPSKYLPMRVGDKREIIDIAKAEDYDFNVWGIINALTYKATHKTETQNKSELYNKKANRVAEWAPDINELIFPIEETTPLQTL